MKILIDRLLAKQGEIETVNAKICILRNELKDLESRLDTYIQEHARILTELQSQSDFAHIFKVGNITYVRVNNWLIDTKVQEVK